IRPLTQSPEFLAQSQGDSTVIPEKQAEIEFVIVPDMSQPSAYQDTLKGKVAIVSSILSLMPVDVRLHLEAVCKLRQGELSLFGYSLRPSGGANVDYVDVDATDKCLRMEWTAMEDTTKALVDQQLAFSKT
ncbi:hypothetical protein CCMA1212_008318, partial [Trichoderma ghanense]